EHRHRSVATVSGDARHARGTFHFKAAFDVEVRVEDLDLGLDVFAAPADEADPSAARVGGPLAPQIGDRPDALEVGERGDRERACAPIRDHAHEEEVAGVD